MGWFSSVGSTVGDAFKNSAGSLVSAVGSYLTNKENLENQDYWNERQIELANTAHQRAVKDLEAAGLNPILAANSAASTPSLSSARLENPLSDFGRNSRELAKALNGLTRSEVEQAEADATTAKAYAGVSSELANAEMEAAQSNSELTKLENDARMDALEGTTSIDHYHGRDGAYADLVEQYRNEIKSGKYKSSLGHAIYDDVRSGISSASDLVGVAKGIKGMLPEKRYRDVKSTTYHRDAKGRIINKSVNRRRLPQ